MGYNSEMISLAENERIDQLALSGVQIVQSTDTFRFGIDAVLLAHFPKIPARGRIVDLCAGNGAVGLLASELTTAQIVEIELQEKLSALTEKSIALNGLTERMSVITDDLKNSLQHLQPSSVDLIFCNPPYFKANTGAQNVNPHHDMARHELTMTFDDIATVSRQLLKDKGHLALVHRPERFFEIIEKLRAANLQPKRIQFVYPKADTSANLVLIDAIKNGSENGEKFLPPLVVYDAEGNYTPQLTEIYGSKKAE